MPSAKDPRAALLAIYAAALQAVHGRTVVRDFLARAPVAGPVHLIALGKAACAMARGAHDALGVAIVDALVVTKHGYAEPLPWPVRMAGHPLPDARSLEAGAALLAYGAGLPPQARVLVLLSGGASSLVEQPPAGVSLADLQAMYDWLLASGLDIVHCNRVRRTLSQIKGGRLAALLFPRRVWVLAISDVPGDDPAVIGSGPLARDTAGADLPVDGLPPFIRKLLQHAPPPPAPGVFAGVETHIVATLAMAKRAAAQAARAAGYAVAEHAGFVAGDAVATGRRLAQAVRDADPGCVQVWGGETTVRLPRHPGRGGRNQSLALAAALELRGQPSAWLLAAGSDGSDGPGDDAGALVDGGSVQRAALHGFDASACLTRADAGSALAASGDLLSTGPTGTNVMDIMLGLRT